MECRLFISRFMICLWDCRQLCLHIQQICYFCTNRITSTVEEELCLVSRCLDSVYHSVGFGFSIYSSVMTDQSDNTMYPQHYWCQTKCHTAPSRVAIQKQVETLLTSDVVIGTSLCEAYWTL